MKKMIRSNTDRKPATYDVVVSWSDFQDAEISYQVEADNEGEAIDAALDAAREELEVSSVQCLDDDSDYEVEIGWGGFTHAYQTYSVWATNDDDAVEAALKQAAYDLDAKIDKPLNAAIMSSTELEQVSGFYSSVGNKGIFIADDNAKVTDRVARKMINAICDLKGVGDKIRQAALYDKPTLADVKYRTSKANLSHVDTGKTTYWSVSGKGFTINNPEEDVDILSEGVYIFD